MRKSELRLGRFHCIGSNILPPSLDLQVSFVYGKREFELIMTNHGQIELYSWKHGQQAAVPSAVKLILWLKARQLGILEKHGFL